MTAEPADRSPRSADAVAPLLTTQELLRRAQEGSPEARDQLLARYLPRLRRWANGRLPMYARSLVDTVDIVQDILIRVFQSLDGIEVRGPGGFEAYVRRAVNNRIRDEIARVAHRPRPEGVPETLMDPGPSPLENAVGADVLQKYERALASLTPEEQQLIHLRIELDLSNDEIAELTARPSRDAARMAVKRALSNLAEAMAREG